MRCPRCGDKSEVLETIPLGVVNKRRRRCLNPHCQHRFQSQEVNAQAVVDVQDGELVKRLRRLHRKTARYDPEALAAAIAVDRRRDEIRARQRQERRDEQYDDDFTDRAPRSLDRDSLKREIDGF